MSSKDLSPQELAKEIGYDLDSKEITQEQHARNLEILTKGLGRVAVEDPESRDILEIFIQESNRYGGKYSGADRISMKYEGFIDVDGYNNYPRQG